MNRAERRKETFRVIEQRKKKLKSYIKDSTPDDIPCDGKLKNNNEMNAFRYTKKKTNWKKRHSNWRTNFGYGVGMDWKKHDKQQLDDMDHQEGEYFNEES